MGSVYDRTEKEYYHNKRHCCTCRDTGILLPNCGQGQLLPDAVFLSAQLYLYRSVRRLGALRPSADRAKAGVQVYDCHRSTAHHMDGSPFGKVFYISASANISGRLFRYFLALDTQAQTRLADTPNSFPISLLARPQAANRPI